MLEFWLETTSGSFRFFARHTSLGRDRRCSFVLPDPSVLPLHASIVEEDGRAFLQKSEYDALTFVNRVPVPERMELYDGDVIDIGPWSLQFRCPSLPRRELPRSFGQRMATPSDVTLVRRVRIDDPLLRSGRLPPPDDSTNSVII